MPRGGPGCVSGSTRLCIETVRASPLNRSRSVFVWFGHLGQVLVPAGHFGAVIARRRPENLIGWLLATIGLLWALVIASAFGSTWALKTGTVSKTVGEWIDVPAFAWVAALGLLGTQLPLRVVSR